MTKEDEADDWVKHAVANARLDGLILDTAWIEKLHDVALGASTASEVVAEELKRVKEALQSCRQQ